MSDQEQTGKQRNFYSKDKLQSRRSFSVRSIGSYIPYLLKPVFRKQSPLLARLILDWEQIVGNTLAQTSVPKRLQKGVLTVSCQGPMALEIHYNMAYILSRINTSCGLMGGDKLTQLKIVQDVMMVPVVRKNPPPERHLVTIENFEEGPLKEALERLGGSIKTRSGK
ncbi:DciA family protein [Acetobacteraceae bacterium ESL0709]|nr:DciA family protein [Acetobacteraceae bacterium ESL0697]MDF7677161.1 DciA family protein [Acetobacteraceae bacterium ESL0709]